MANDPAVNGASQRMSDCPHSEHARLPISRLTLLNNPFCLECKDVRRCWTCEYKAKRTISFISCWVVG